jgi:hypothetical protein
MAHERGAWRMNNEQLRSRVMGLAAPWQSSPIRASNGIYRVAFRWRADKSFQGVAIHDIDRPWKQLGDVIPQADQAIDVRHRW